MSWSLSSTVGGTVNHAYDFWDPSLSFFHPPVSLWVIFMILLPSSAAYIVGWSWDLVLLTYTFIFINKDITFWKMIKKKTHRKSFSAIPVQTTFPSILFTL